MGTRYVKGRSFRLSKIRGGTLPPRMAVDNCTREENIERVKAVFESERKQAAGTKEPR